MKRRNFLRQGGLATLGLGLTSAMPTEWIAAARSRLSPNDRIGVGLIGCKGMGWSNLRSMLKMPEVHAVALCDVDAEVLRQRQGELSALQPHAPALHEDYRKLLAMREVDVVIIATPDHWHCLQMADACAAGKDVYVEKPVANSIGESRRMVEAATRYRRVVQVNQWQRSQQHFRDAVAFVQSGQLGRIALAKTWMHNAHAALPQAPNGAVPPGVNYDMWLGPAPRRPFNPNRFHYNFRWYWDYAGGLMTDWGVHLIDVVLWATNATYPRTVASLGGPYAHPGDARETPDTQQALFDFADYQLTWEHTMGRTTGLFDMGHGIAFIGDKGTMLLNRGGWKVVPQTEDKKPKMEAVDWKPQVDNGLDLHTRNFIDAVKARDHKLLNCPIEAGALVAEVSHMGNVALRSGKLLTWDARSRRFDDAGANKLILPDYHGGWKMPGF